MKGNYSNLIYLYEGSFGYRIVKSLLRFILKAFFDLKVSGLESLPTGTGVIFAGNHTSLLDGVILMAAYPKRVYFLVAESVFKKKILGFFARQLGFIPVKKTVSNKEAIKEAVRILEARNAIGIFPEGKITDTEELAKGRPGVAALAMKTNTPIIPFAIEGAYYAWPAFKKRPKRHPVKIHFGRALKVEKYDIPEELTSEVMAEIRRIKINAEKEGLLEVDPNIIVKHLINF